MGRLNNPHKTLENLNQVIKFVLQNNHSNFYLKKYKKAQINTNFKLKTLEDLAKLPLLTRPELVNTSPFERLFLPEDDLEMMEVTSGTTGGKYPLGLFHTKPHQIQIDAVIKAAKLTKVKNYLFLLPPLAGQTRLIRFSFLKEYNIQRLLGDIQNMNLTAKIAALFKVDAIETTPTGLYYLLPYLKKEYDPKKIKLITLGGEYCSEQKAKFLKRAFKNAYFRFIFGGAETGQKGYRCEYLDKLPVRFFHPLPIFHFEIQNSQQDGELILTHLTTQIPFPLIRYKTGDWAKFDTKECQCGASSTIELLGKMELDVAKISGVMIYAQNIAQALVPFRTYLETLDFRLHIYESIDTAKISTKLKLQLIPFRHNNPQLKQTLEEGISERLFLSAGITLKDLVLKGVFEPLEVELLKEFPFEHKQKHIISHLA